MTLSRVAKTINDWYRAYSRNPLFFLHVLQRPNEINRIAPEVLFMAATGRVLDVGTGPGYMLQEVSQRAPNVEIVGVEPNETLAKAARKRLVRANLVDRAHVIKGDAAKLPFSEESFDVVVTTFSVHLWSDWKGSFEEIFRVLKPGGNLLIIAGHDYLYKRSLFLRNKRPKLERLLREVGFVSTEEIRYGLLWMFTRAKAMKPRNGATS